MITALIAFLVTLGVCWLCSPIIDSFVDFKSREWQKEMEREEEEDRIRKLTLEKLDREAKK